MRLGHRGRPFRRVHRLRNYLQLGLERARMEGSVFLDYLDRFPEAFGRLHEWMTQGDIVYAEDIQEGLEHAPTILRGLFEGRNLGKQLLRIAPRSPHTQT
jgi:NADPH-dependent curcumin reductase CurA